MRVAVHFAVASLSCLLVGCAGQQAPRPPLSGIRMPTEPGLHWYEEASSELREIRAADPSPTDADRRARARAMPAVKAALDNDPDVPLFLTTRAEIRALGTEVATAAVERDLIDALLACGEWVPARILLARVHGERGDAIAAAEQLGWADEALLEIERMIADGPDPRPQRSLLQMIGVAAPKIQTPDEANARRLELLLAMLAEWDAQQFDGPSDAGTGAALLASTPATLVGRLRGRIALERALLAERHGAAPQTTLELIESAIVRGDRNLAAARVAKARILSQLEQFETAWHLVANYVSRQSSTRLDRDVRTLVEAATNLSRWYERNGPDGARDTADGLLAAAERLNPGHSVVRLERARLFVVAAERTRDMRIAGAASEALIGVDAAQPNDPQAVAALHERLERLRNSLSTAATH